MKTRAQALRRIHPLGEWFRRLGNATGRSRSNALWVTGRRRRGYAAARSALLPLAIDQYAEPNKYHAEKRERVGFRDRG